MFMLPATKMFSSGLLRGLRLFDIDVWGLPIDAIFKGRDGRCILNATEGYVHASFGLESLRTFSN